MCAAELSEVLWVMVHCVCNVFAAEPSEVLWVMV
uniref:Uncharacterized protein n=1 Tax=Anguilla anguilla TaxID=7936 RepID=A0A0E9PEY4_ANGAN